MSLLVDLYDSRSLTKAINKINATQPFILDKFFGAKEPHSADKVDIEIYTGSGKTAQFVSANDPEPKSVKKTTKTVKTVTIPRTYECKVFTAKELWDFNAIGNFYGTDQERKAAQQERVARELAEMKDRVLRLREYMAGKALSAGKVSMDQDNFAFEIDFGFANSAQLITLTGADLWSASTSDPVKNLRAWLRSIARASNLSGSALLLGATAADAFVSNAGVLKALDNLNTRVGVMDMTTNYPGASLLAKNFMGLEVWEYNQQYVTPAGVATDIIPTDRAVLVAASDTMRTHFGPAYRINNNSSEAITGEFLLEVDKAKSSQTMIQWNCEQKSLPAVHDAGCVVSAKVV